VYRIVPETFLSRGVSRCLTPTRDAYTHCVVSQSRKHIALLCLAVFAFAAITSFIVATPAILVELGVAIFAIAACVVRTRVESQDTQPALIALRASHHLPRASILPAVR
jgi:hypothetical protein